jgi:hypothetical protein
MSGEFEMDPIVSKKEFETGSFLNKKSELMGDQTWD